MNPLLFMIVCVFLMLCGLDLIEQPELEILAVVWLWVMGVLTLCEYHGISLKKRNHQP